MNRFKKSTGSTPRSGQDAVQDVENLAKLVRALSSRLEVLEKGGAKPVPAFAPVSQAAAEDGPPTPRGGDADTPQGLFLLCAGSDASAAEKALARAKDVSFVNPADGRTCLHAACAQGHEQVVSMLLEKKADATKQDNDGMAPFHLAAQGGHTGICVTLIEANVDINILNSAGWTPLMVACKHSQTDAATYLISHNADLNVVSTNKNDCALSLACENGLMDVLQALQKHRANLSIRIGAVDPCTVLQRLHREGEGENAQASKEFLLSHIDVAEEVEQLKPGEEFEQCVQSIVDCIKVKTVLAEVEQSIATEMRPEDAGHSHRSVFFDIKAKSKPITVSALVGGVSQEGPITIYASKGSGINRADQPDAWEIVGEGTFENRRSTEIRLSTPVRVGAGESVGIYVHCHGGRVQYNKPHNGNLGDVHAENEFVQLINGGCHLQDDAFVNARVGPMHMLAGAIKFKVSVAPGGASAANAVVDEVVLNTEMRPEDSGHSHRAVFFDVKAKDQPLQITGIFGGVSQEGPITIYTSEGSGLAVAGEPRAWTVAAQGTFQTKRTSEIVLPNPVRVAPGQSVGFYVHCKGGRVQYNKPHNGNLGDVHCENQYMQIINGGCHLQDDAFVNPRVGPMHMLAGGVHAQVLGGGAAVATGGAVQSVNNRIAMEMSPEKAGHSHHSVFFDVKAKSSPVTVRSVFGGVSQEGPITIYAYRGSGINHAESASGWEKVAEGTFANRKTTEIVLLSPVQINPGESAGFYVHCQGGRVQYNKPHNGTLGSVHVENEHVQIINGGCHLQDDAFVNARAGPMHMLAGEIGYSIGVESKMKLFTEMKPEDAGHSHRAVFFDVKAKGKPIQITAVMGGCSEQGPITVYAFHGSGINHAGDPSGWRRVGTGTFQKRQTTVLKLDSPIAVAPGESVGLYVHCRGGRLQYNKPHNGNLGDVHRENDFAQLINGGCHLQDEPFSNPRVGPMHIIAGGIELEVKEEEKEAPKQEQQQQVEEEDDDEEENQDGNGREFVKFVKLLFPVNMNTDPAAFLAIHERPMAHQLKLRLQDLVLDFEVDMRNSPELQKRMQLAKGFINIQIKAAGAHLGVLEEVYTKGRTVHKKMYDQVMSGIKREGGFQGFSKVASDVQAVLSSGGKAPSVHQQSPDILTLFTKARDCSPKFDDFIAALAEKSGGDFLSAPIKSLFRSLEKVGLREDNQWDATGLCDIVRGGVEFGDMQNMTLFFNLMCSATDGNGNVHKTGSGAMDAKAAGVDAKIVFIRIKNRFDKATSGGWRDCLINFYFEDDPDKHVCEVQLVHKRLMLVRKQMGAHKQYAQFRSALELLEASGQAAVIQRVDRQEEEREAAAARAEAAAIGGTGGDDSELGQAVDNLAARINDIIARLDRLERKVGK